MFDFLIFKNAFVYVEVYSITLFIINKKSTSKRVIIFRDILKKKFFKKITKVSIVSFNNELTNL